MESVCNRFQVINRYGTYSKFVETFTWDVYRSLVVHLHNSDPIHEAKDRKESRKLSQFFRTSQSKKFLELALRKTLPLPIYILAISSVGRWLSCSHYTQKVYFSMGPSLISATLFIQVSRSECRRLVTSFAKKEHDITSRQATRPHQETKIEGHEDNDWRHF